MKDINALKREAAKILEKREKLLELQRTRALSDVEKEHDQLLEREYKRMESEIATEKRAQDREAGTARNLSSNEVREFGDFLREVRDGGHGLEKRDVSMGNGPSMGFMVPETFDTTIRQVTPQEAIFRPRATVIPGGSTPDAAINLLSLDQSGSKGVYNGLTVSWIAENATRQDAGDPTLKNIKLEPREVSAYVDVSDKLLSNSAAAGQVISNLLRSAIIGAEEDAFYTGSGVGKPLGIKGHASVKTVTRNTASSVKWVDIRNMIGAFMFGKSAIWVCNQSCLPELMAIEDTNGNALWMPDAKIGIGGSLCGIPLLINDLNPALGTEGDLALLDMSYYYIKDGSPLAIFIDPYTQKVNGLSRIYAFWNVDGQPMLTSPITQRNGSTTVSPFVLLK